MLSKHCNPVHIVLPKLTWALLIATPSLKARGSGSELARRAWGQIPHAKEMFTGEP